MSVKAEAGPERKMNAQKPSRGNVFPSGGFFIVGLVLGSFATFGVMMFTEADNSAGPALTQCQREKQDVANRVGQLEAQVAEHRQSSEGLGACRSEHADAKRQLEEVTSMHAKVQEVHDSMQKEHSRIQGELGQCGTETLSVRKELENLQNEKALHEKAKADLTTEHQKVKADLTALHEKATAELISQHEKVTTELYSQHEKVTAELISEREKAVSELEAEKQRTKAGSTVDSTKPGAVSTELPPVVLAQSGFEQLKAHCGAGMGPKCTAVQAISTMSWAMTKLKMATLKSGATQDVFELMDRVLADCTHVRTAINRGLILDAPNFEVLYVNCVDLYHHVLPMAQSADKTKRILPLVGELCKNTECT